jgi:hypothetical protein
LPSSQFFGGAATPRWQPGGRTPELLSESSRIAKTAAATASPPHNMATLNIPKAEWKTVFVITKWHATGAEFLILRSGAISF